MNVTTRSSSCDATGTQPSAAIPSPSLQAIPSPSLREARMAEQQPLGLHRSRSEEGGKGRLAGGLLGVGVEGVQNATP